MKTIWKYPITLLRTRIEMPRGAEILSFQLQQDVPTIWACVDPDKGKVARTVRVYGTGAEMNDVLGKYIGTAQESGYVWHAFDEGEK